MFGQKMFTQGKFTAKGHFQELVKDHWSLPWKDHAKLEQDIILDDSLRKLEKDRTNKSVFLFQDQISAFMDSGSSWDALLLLWIQDRVGKALLLACQSLN